jgi:hypothetical protein
MFVNVSENQPVPILRTEMNIYGIILQMIMKSSLVAYPNQCSAHPEPHPTIEHYPVRAGY